MPRFWMWLQLLIGWVPVWLLYSTMIATAHPDTTMGDALLIGARAIGCAALLGLPVFRLTQRLRWPRPMRLSFIAVHVLAAPVFAVAWMGLTTLVEHLISGPWSGAGVVVVRLPLARYLVMGSWLYIIVAGVAYAIGAAERAAQAEAAAVRAQLAALRSQLNPHFLFNALHSVVQLIPVDPARASGAAEQVAGLLRTVLEEDRDQVSLGEEWEFVERYLAVERIRFGDRMRLAVDLPEAARTAVLPSFAVQTLVENAVRHGVEPSAGETTVTVRAAVEAGTLRVEVSDDGAGSPPSGGGTGLGRLRERLSALYGAAARLESGARPGGGWRAVLEIPQ